MTLTPDTLEQLGALCREATQPGPWSVKPSDPNMVLDANGFWVADCGEAPKDAAFIAALSPDVATALVEIAQAAVRWADEGDMPDGWQRHDELRAAIDRARGGAR